jgi:DNA-binding NarL/FixJ family response regulator
MIMISILLVEDHAAFASVLVRLLSRAGDLEVTEVARTAEIALQKLPEQNFNLVLVDVFLPQMSGISLVALIHDRYPDLPCMMLSGHMLDHYVQRALQAGARGYVLKDHSDEIIEGIQHVMKGETYLSKELRHA